MAKRAKALVSSLVLVVASAFVIASTWQLTAAVFATPPSGSADPSLVSCSEQLRPLASALERAADRAGTKPDTASAMHEFEAALDPEWAKAPEAEKACGETPAGVEAYASLLRLRRGLEGHSRRAVKDLEPLRRDFQARLR